MDRNIDSGDGTGLVSVLFAADLTRFLGQGDSSGWICGTTAQTDVANFGFHAGLTDCGALVGQ